MRTPTWITPQHSLALEWFANCAVRVCIRYGASVTSWHRSAARNAAVGGVPNSWHLLGLAADIVLDDDTQRAACIEYARALGLIAIDEGDHIHLEVPPGTAI